MARYRVAVAARSGNHTRVARSLVRGRAALGLLALLVATTIGAQVLPQGERRFPATPFVVDVTRPPYGAKGDGVTDDTEALQRAIAETVGQRRLLFFPNGTYLVSSTLTWPKRWKERDNWGFTFLCGQDRDHCTIRLKDATFTDPAAPQAVMWCGGFGSADWFHNYVENLTIDVGSGNPGATALAFYSNNSGAVRDCRFVAAAGSGAVGLDLARDMNGPLLVRNCEVVGFGRGIVTGRAVNGQALEHITLRGQRGIGLQNEGQSLSIRGLRSDNAVPAVGSYGTLVLVDATLAGHGVAAGAPAVINYNGGRCFLRDIQTTGYRRALADLTTPDFAAAFRIQGEDRPGSLGPDLVEYCSQAPTSPFPSAAHSLRLPVAETPDVPWDEPRTWANVDDFGADPTGQADSAAAIQKAIDSGATTVLLPGSYTLQATITLRGKMRRLLGLGGMINYGKGLRPDLRVADGAAPVVTVEHFAHIGGGLELDSRRTLVLRSVMDCTLSSTPAGRGGQLFLEDVVTHELQLHGQRLWARQLNIENEGMHLVNDASDLWILGYKTERGGTLLETRGGGRSEILGGFSYTTTAGSLGPMFVNEDSAVYAFFAEVCATGNPFAELVRETRNAETRTIGRSQGHTLPYSGHAGTRLPTAAAPVRAFCIDFNWGEGGPNGFAPPGLWAEASPEAHVAWYAELGCNVIQTFAVSCNGYAWYRGGVVPPQPGLGHDFLTDVVRLGHRQGMRVMGYFCVGANSRWGQLHPELSYDTPSAPHLPFTTAYLDYLDSAIADALTRTGMDGFMIDWVWNPGDLDGRALRWLACEQAMYQELFGEAFPGKERVTAARELEFRRRAIDRAWARIRDAARRANPQAVIWLSCCNVSAPVVVDSALFREVDWLMNEATDPGALAKVESMKGPHTRLIQCVVGWGEAHDARRIVADPANQHLGIYGFAKPGPSSLPLPVADYHSHGIASFSGNDRNIAVLARYFTGASLEIVVSADAEGRVTLEPGTATLHGSSPIVMEGQIGHWGDARDTVSWLIELRQPGRYELRIEYACDKGMDGSSFAVGVAGQTFALTSEETGSWRAYRTVPAGQVEVTTAGRQTLSVVPDPKTPWHAISLKSVTLVPVR